MTFVVCLGHGIFHPVAALVFSKFSFFREVLTSQTEETSGKKWCSTSMVARVFPSEGGCLRSSVLYPLPGFRLKKMNVEPDEHSHAPTRISRGIFV